MCLQLVKSNDQIGALKVLLNTPATVFNQVQLLALLSDVEVDKMEYLSLESIKHQVLVKQYMAVNARYTRLRI